jgi:hypothetical protein
MEKGNIHQGGVFGDGEGGGLGDEKKGERMLKEIMLLVFWPTRFIKFATEETVKAEFKTNKQLKESFPNEQLPLEKYMEFEKGIRGSTYTIRHSFAVGFGWVLLAIGGGWVLGWFLGCFIVPASKSVITGLQLLAAGILLGATLSLVGWEIQTHKGQTLPEKVNQYVYRALYTIGTGILVVSLSWSQ